MLMSSNEQLKFSVTPSRMVVDPPEELVASGERGSTFFWGAMPTAKLSTTQSDLVPLR
jgi:hypothetical protein